MANRIQLRRDTAANWTRENPILSQGEPGFDLTANKLKVGDGVTAWAELDYASGAGANFDYSTLQEGLFVPFGGVTSITGNHDTNTGVGLTSESWAQLMWVPDTGVVTVDEISDGANVYNWAYVDDQGFRITNHVNTATHQWQFNTSGHLILPEGGVIKNFDDSTYGGGGSVTTSTLVNSTSTVSLGSDGKLTLPGDLELLSTKDIIKSGNRTALFKSSVTLAAMGAEGGGLLTAANFTIRTVNNTSTYTLTFASSTPTDYSWSGFGMDMSTGAPINVWGPKFTATATQDYTLGTFATVGDTFQIILTDYTTGYLYRITSVLTTTSSSSTTVERIA